MKRSQALAKLKIFLEEVNIYARDVVPEEAVLNFVEKELEMQPPTITVLKDSYNRGEGKMGFDANEWESEDGN